MSTILRSPAALYTREVEMITAFREWIRSKAAYELVVTVVYPAKTGPYWAQVASPGGLVGPDGQTATQLVRVNAIGVRLGILPNLERWTRTDPHTLTHTVDHV